MLPSCPSRPPNAPVEPVARQLMYHNENARDEKPQNEARQDRAQHWHGNPVQFSRLLDAAEFSSPLCRHQLNYSHVTHFGPPYDFLEALANRPQRGHTILANNRSVA